MHTETKKRRKPFLGLAALILGLFTANASMAAPNDRNESLDQAVMQTLANCQSISASCRDTTKDALGVLVFPSVVKADLIVGGAGGKGALIENGKITGYYNIGAASAGLQAGVENASQVYVFRSQEALNDLKQNNDWKVGANAGVTVVNKDANASAVSGNVLAYIFDSKGLNAGVAANVFNVWKAGKPRPQAS
jgi:lipid-binding SYLF domain-containing protein